MKVFLMLFLFTIFFSHCIVGRCHISTTPSHHSQETPPAQLPQYVPLKPGPRDPHLPVLDAGDLHRLRQGLVAPQQGGHLAVGGALLGGAQVLGLAAQVDDGADAVVAPQAVPVGRGGLVGAGRAEEQALAQELLAEAGVDGGADVAEVEDVAEAAVLEEGGFHYRRVGWEVCRSIEQAPEKQGAYGVFILFRFGLVCFCLS